MSLKALECGCFPQLREAGLVSKMRSRGVQNGFVVVTVRLFLMKLMILWYRKEILSVY